MIVGLAIIASCMIVTAQGAFDHAEVARECVLAAYPELRDYAADITFVNTVSLNGAWTHSPQLSLKISDTAPNFSAHLPTAAELELLAASFEFDSTGRVLQFRATG